MSINVPDCLAQELHSCKLLALPQSAARVLELAKNPENGPPELAVPISADPGLMAQILRFANSSFFGFQHKITAVQMALSLICIRTIKNFVLWNAVFAMLPNPKVGPFVLRLVLQDALRRGVFCKVFASYFQGIDPEEIFVVGLFQDIAVPI
ncbi:MAG: HDOD domain-containing protein, partial [Planctomycetaceae bacterium]|nr:HDOD domain-containing protein [Planctomycetaceae bacterium]